MAPGNAPSNVVYLRELYPENTATPVTPSSENGYLKVYLEGIGTRSRGEDSLFGMDMGLGETGVVARVEQAHNLIGGGYLPRGRERLWLTQPERFTVERSWTVESTGAWKRAQTKVQTLLASGLAGDGKIGIKTWPIQLAPRGKLEPAYQDHMLTLELERTVRGELSLIALRVMRELGVRHGVPFKSLESRPDLALPMELQPIAARILDQVQGGNEISLDPDEERLLRSRYIHQSAHWVPSKGLLISKPAEKNIRNVYDNLPQKGYPQ